MLLHGHSYCCCWFFDKMIILLVIFNWGFNVGIVPEFFFIVSI